MQPGLRIGELAKLCGVSIDTIRYYEDSKLLPRAPRSGGGFRLFTTETVERIRFIRRAQEIGLSLKEIRRLLGTAGGSNECQQVRDLLRVKLAELDGRMKILSEFRDVLDRYRAACDKQLKRRGPAAKCPVLFDITNTANRRSDK